MSALQKLPAQEKPRTLRQTIENQAPEFKRALPGHIPVERFVRTVHTALQMNPQVAQAATKSEGGMHSLLAACTKAATDGLILDGREAVLVTFRQKVGDNQWEDRVQYIPMVAGLMKKARNSGEIANISAHVVYEKDTFTYVLGDDERIEHAPYLNGDRGKPIAVYAIARLKDGSIQREVMDRAAIMRIAKQSRNERQYLESSPNFAEWWRKTVIRRISKYLPSSSDRDEFQQAVERIDDEFEFEAEATADGNVTVMQPVRKKRGAAAAVLKDVTPKQDEAEATDQKPPHDPETGEVIDYEQGPEDDI